jgi:two-component sensor histidine kinase
LTLINDLLDQSKLEAGRIEVTLKGCSAPALVEETVATLQPLVAGKQLRLQVVGEQVPLVQADALRLKQVLYNLMANAIKFTPAGGSIEVRTRVSNDGQQVCTTVADSGPGIAAAELGLLFTPFVQLEGGAAKKGGTGLGLSLSKKLVELMGGTIHVHSEVGHGAAFTVELPVYQAERVTPTSSPSLAPEPPPGPRPTPPPATVAPVATVAPRHRWCWWSTIARTCAATSATCSPANTASKRRPTARRAWRASARSSPTSSSAIS